MSRGSRDIAPLISCRRSLDPRGRGGDIRLFPILSDLVWYSFVSGAVACGRRFLSDRGYRLLVGCCALFILGFGLYFGYRDALALAG